MIIGIDMGGTNIDGVVIAAHDGRIVRQVKRPVDRSDYFRSIWNCIKELLRGTEKEDIKRINLSTTVSTNAIVENRISKVGVILQRGPGLKWRFDDLGENVVDVTGSTDHRGIPVSGENPDELTKIKADFLNNSIEAAAVVGKFSTRNPEFEKRAEEYLRDSFREVTMGHTLSGRLNFPRRVRTAYLNAAVCSTFKAFAENIEEALRREGIGAPVYILKADGGTVSLKGAKAKPVETILSGPAASLMGMTALLDEKEADRCLLDIGGTTTDLFFLADGVPVFEPSGIEIGGHKTLVRAVYSTSAGLGGDSYVRMEDGKLKIGPERKGHAVAFGGKHLTPTDALVYLGVMEAEHSRESAEALESMAKEIRMPPGEFAGMIIGNFCKSVRETIENALKKINSNPVYTIKELLDGRTVKPRSVGVIGGPAKALSKYLERELGLPVEYPPNHEIANAIGAALARPTAEITLLADTEREILSIPETGVYEKIGRTYDLRRAKERALSEVKSAGQAMGISSDVPGAEITEESSFNMVKEYRAYKNIRVKAQIKPGLVICRKAERG
ncbi:MAG: hydantoinase/oxoprolinase family protein [Clostridiales bacterium]|nr:hydantoinase/oxoprolinase family protein [Clostridiales bacterium]